MSHSKIFKWRSHVRRILKFEYEIPYKVSQEWMYFHKDLTKKMYEQEISHADAAETLYELIMTEYKKDE